MNATRSFFSFCRGSPGGEATGLRPITGLEPLKRSHRALGARWLSGDAFHPAGALQRPHERDQILLLLIGELRLQYEIEELDGVLEREQWAAVQIDLANVSIPVVKNP